MSRSDIRLKRPIPPGKYSCFGLKRTCMFRVRRHRRCCTTLPRTCASNYAPYTVAVVLAKQRYVVQRQRRGVDVATAQR